MAATPVIRIDLASPTPAYRQIANTLRAVLVGGGLAPGDQLPTVRQLALDLGVHHNTVAEAYRLLADEGWLEMRRRHGVTVRARTQPRPAPALHDGFVRRLGELVAEAIAAGLPATAIAGALRDKASDLERVRRGKA